MRTSYILLIFLPAALFSQASSASIVPERDHIDDDQTKRIYAETLFKQKRSLREALDIFKTLQRKHPLDSAIELDVEKVEWALNHPEKIKIVDSLVDKESYISDETARLTLVQIYASHKDTYLEAIALYWQLLEQKPGDAAILLTIANLYTNLKLYSEARAIIGCIDIGCDQHDLHLKLAQLEATLGYSVKSHLRYEYLLSRQPNDEKLLIAYADSMLSWGDFYTAETIYRRAYSLKDEDRLLKILDVLVATQRFFEAEDLACELASAGMKIEIIYPKLVTIKRLQNDFKAALDYIDVAIDNKPEDFSFLATKAALYYQIDEFDAALALCLQLIKNKEFAADAHLLAGRCYEALNDCEQAREQWCSALEYPDVQIAASFYLAGACAATSSFIESAIAEATSAQQLHIFANLYAEKGLPDEVERLYVAALEIDPDYVPASHGLADILATQMSYAASLEFYDQLLASMPGNTKFLLGKARTISWSKDYLSSIDAYQILIDENPLDPIPRVEQARVAMWGKLYDIAMEKYSALLDILAEDTWGQCLLKESVRNEIALRQEEWLHHTIFANQLNLDLLAMDPGSVIWKYETAQSFCSLGLCQNAKSLYEDILHEAPLHTLARLSLLRELEKEKYAAALAYAYWQEIGYGELSQVGRYQGTFAVNIPISCRQHLRLADQYWVEHTFYDKGYHAADGQTVEWQCLFDNLMNVNAGITHKRYHHTFGTFFNYFANLTVTFADNTKWDLGYIKKEEVYNYFNLLQRTQAQIYWTSFKTYLSHASCIDGLYQYIKYSDHNSMQHAVLNYEYAFTEHPKVLKATLTAEYRNTARFNIFIYDASGQLIDIIYPYWTPQHYFLGQVLFEWRHDYGDLEFCAAPARFFDVKLSVGKDTQLNPFFAFKTEWVYEFFSTWKFSVIGFAHFSPMWNARALWCTANYNF